MHYAIFGGNLAPIGEYSSFGDFSKVIGEKSPIRCPRVKGGHQGSSSLVMARQGGWTIMIQWPKTLKAKLNLKRDYQARIRSGQMVLMVVKRGSWTALTVARDAQGRVKKRLKEAKRPT